MSYKNLPFGEIEKFNVIVETPKGSQNKYEYDESLDLIKFECSFNNGFCFPFDYGSAPQTLGGDNDPLDVFIISDHPSHPGTITECKPIGMIELLDQEEVDNKIIAVGVRDKTYNKLESIDELKFDYEKIFRDFFKELAIQKTKKMEIKGFRDKKIAIDYIKEAIENFKSDN